MSQGNNNYNDQPPRPPTPFYPTANQTSTPEKTNENRHQNQDNYDSDTSISTTASTIPDPFDYTVLNEIINTDADTPTTTTITYIHLPEMRRTPTPTTTTTDVFHNQPMVKRPRGRNNTTPDKEATGTPDSIPSTSKTSPTTAEPMEEDKSTATQTPWPTNAPKQIKQGYNRNKQRQPDTAKPRYMTRASEKQLQRQTRTPTEKTKQQQIYAIERNKKRRIKRKAKKRQQEQQQPEDKITSTPQAEEPTTTQGNQPQPNDNQTEIEAAQNLLVLSRQKSMPPNMRYGAALTTHQLFKMAIHLKCVIRYGNLNLRPANSRTHDLLPAIIIYKDLEDLKWQKKDIEKANMPKTPTNEEWPPEVRAAYSQMSVLTWEMDMYDRLAESKIATTAVQQQATNAQCEVMSQTIMRRMQHHHGALKTLKTTLDGELTIYRNTKLPMLPLPIDLAELETTEAIKKTTQNRIDRTAAIIYCFSQRIQFIRNTTNYIVTMKNPYHALPAPPNDFNTANPEPPKPPKPPSQTIQQQPTLNDTVNREKVLTYLAKLAKTRELEIIEYNALTTAIHRAAKLNSQPMNPITDEASQATAKINGDWTEIKWSKDGSTRITYQINCRVCYCHDTVLTESKNGKHQFLCNNCQQLTIL
jgi:hypothetical protein